MFNKPETKKNTKTNRECTVSAGFSIFFNSAKHRFFSEKKEQISLYIYLYYNINGNPLLTIKTLSQYIKSRDLMYKYKYDHHKQTITNGQFDKIRITQMMNHIKQKERAMEIFGKRENKKTWH